MLGWMARGRQDPEHLTQARGPLLYATNMTDHQTVLTIEGMTCGHCTAAVKKALLAMPGVRSVDVQLAPGTATVVHDGTAAALFPRVVEDEGYAVRSVR